MKRLSLIVTMLAALILTAGNAMAYYVVTAAAEAKGPIRLDMDVLYSAGDTHIVSPEVIGWYTGRTDVFTVTEVNVTGAELNLIDGGVTKTTANVGTAGTGVTAVEYGDGLNHTTVLTVAVTDAVTVADGAALCDGYLVYTFPAGEVIVNSASISMGVTLAEDTDATPELCIGNVLGSDAQATCGEDDAGLENILGPATADDCAGTAEVLTAATNSGAPLVLATADDHKVYFNLCATWSDTAGADLTGDIAGTVVINWQFMQ